MSEISLGAVTYFDSSSLFALPMDLLTAAGSAARSCWHSWNQVAPSQFRVRKKCAKCTAAVHCCSVLRRKQDANLRSGTAGTINAAFEELGLRVGSLDQGNVRTRPREQKNSSKTGMLPLSQISQYIQLTDDTLHLRHTLRMFAHSCLTCVSLYI